MNTTFELFKDRFNDNESAETETDINIKLIEDKFAIKLPIDYKLFLTTCGDLWTPKILDYIDDEELELNDAQQFWKIEAIIFDKENEWTSRIETNLIPFASDCMGSIFAFKTEELKRSNSTSKVYFYDHDYGTIDEISSSFTEWINTFLKIIRN